VAQVDGDQLGDRRLVLDHQNSTHATPFQRTIVSTSTPGCANVRALDDVDDDLGQVLGVVTHTLDGLGDENEIDARRDRARIFHHEGDQLAHQALELLVDLVVLLQHSDALSVSRRRRRRAPCAAA
jgi:hypothetical protein